MTDWNTKDYNDLYKNYVYIPIGQEDVKIKELDRSFTVYRKIILQRYKIINNSKTLDRKIKVYDGIFHRKYYKWYDDTFIRIKK